LSDVANTSELLALSRKHQRILKLFFRDYNIQYQFADTSVHNKIGLLNRWEKWKHRPGKRIQCGVLMNKTT
jgi:hypothetical protein